MHQEHGRERPGPGRHGHQRVHRAAGSVDEGVGDRHRAGGTWARRCQDHLTRRRADHRGLGSAGPGVLDGAVRAGGGVADRARRGVQSGADAVQAEPVQGGAAARLGPQQQRGAVGVPVDVDVPGQVDLQPLLGAGHRVPDQRLRAAVALVHAQQPRVAGGGGERDGLQPQPVAVPQLGDDVGCVLAAQGQHPERLVAHVAVLGVLDRHQGLVPAQAADTGVVLAAVEHLRGRARPRHPHRRAVVVRAPDHDDVAAHLEPGGVGRRHARCGVDVRAAGERLALPGAELVAVGVVEPPHLGAVRRQRAVAGAVVPVGDLPHLTAAAVPGEQLEGAGRVADVQAAVRGVAGPLRKADPGGAQALLPGRDVGSGHALRR